MTFVLGMGTPPLGVICADTRMNMRTPAGGIDRNDTGELDLSLRDGSVLNIPPIRRKIRRFDWGWAAGAGSSHLLNVAIFDHLADAKVHEANDICSHVSSAVEQRGDAIRSEFTNPDPADRVGIICLFDDGSRFSVRQCVVGSEFHQVENADYAMSFPTDVGRGFSREWNQHASELLFVPENSTGLWELARRVAGIIHAVHENSASVSDWMDLILMVRQNQSRTITLQLHARSSEVRTADDSWIAGQFQRI
ncbi:MAG: hypothetical protein WEA09_05285 [Gemmatimonadota bacterium]